MRKSWGVSEYEYERKHDRNPTAPQPSQRQTERSKSRLATSECSRVPASSISTKTAKSTSIQQLPGIEYKWDDVEKEIFFYGYFPKKECDRLLRGNGDFILRIAEVNKEDRVVISVRAEEKGADVMHFLIQQFHTGEYYIGQRLFKSISDLVAFHYHKQSPLEGEKNSAMLTHTIRKQPWLLENDMVKEVFELGKGHFGTVQRGMLTMPSDKKTVAAGSSSALVHVAVKVAKKPSVGRLTHLIHQASKWKEFQHQNILKFYGLAIQKQPIRVVVEYANGGSLLEYLRKEGLRMVSLRERIRYCMEAARGMEYLEKKKCVHGDLTAKHCLLDDDKVLKLADYGLYTGETESKPDWRIRRWYAPETILTSIRTFQSDAWAFGILIWEIFSDGLKPYKGMTTMEMSQKIVMEQYRMDPPQGTPTPFANLMTECWKGPEDRPDFKKIRTDMELSVKRHGFFR